MMNFRTYLHSVKPFIVLFLGLAQMKLFTLIRENDSQRFYIYPHNPEIDFFPCYDIVMTLRTYVHYASSHIALMAIYWFISRFIFSRLFVAMFFLELIDLVDYFLVYNKPYSMFWYFKYGDFKLIVQLVFIFATWIQSFKSFSSR